MRTDRIKLGVVGGIIGGMAMAMWMMLYYLATNRGFWKPVGYIGHVVLRTGSVTAAGPVVAGIVIHMMMSMVLGALIAQVLPADRLLSMAVGVMASLVVWVVLQYGFLNLVDKAAFHGLVPWAFAVGHVMYGAGLGLIAAPSPVPARERASLAA